MSRGRVCPACPAVGLSCVLHVQENVCPACPALHLSAFSRAMSLSVLCRKPQESEPLLPPVGAASHRQQRTAALAEPDTSGTTGCQRLSPVPASEAPDTPVTLLDTFMVLYVFSVLPEGLRWLCGCPRNFRPATDFLGVNILCITHFSVVLRGLLIDTDQPGFVTQ